MLLNISMKIGQKVRRDFRYSSFGFSLDWKDEPKVDRYEVLRLIYQGRFLHGNVTLGALRLQQGKFRYFN